MTPETARMLVKEQSAQKLILSAETDAALFPSQVREALAATMCCISATNRF